jgi:hypothetical protein
LIERISHCNSRTLDLRSSSITFWQSEMFFCSRVHPILGDHEKVPNKNASRSTPGITRSIEGTRRKMREKWNASQSTTQKHVKGNEKQEKIEHHTQDMSEDTYHSSQQWINEIEPHVWRFISQNIRIHDENNRSLKVIKEEPLKATYQARRQSPGPKGNESRKKQRSHV